MGANELLSPQSHKGQIKTRHNNTHKNTQNKQNTQKYSIKTYIQANTLTQNKTSPNWQQDHTCIENQCHQQSIYINSSAPLITKHKYAQKHKKGDHSHQWLNIILNSTLKLNTIKKTILISTTKQKQKQRKEEEGRRVRTIIPSRVLIVHKLPLSGMVLWRLEEHQLLISQDTSL